MGWPLLKENKFKPNNDVSRSEMKGMPPEMEANAEEAPYLKEAEAFLMWEETKLEANALPPMRFLASLIFC